MSTEIVESVPVVGSGVSPTDVEPAPRLTWESFQWRWWNDWAQGEHVAVLAPTGAGKGTLVRELVKVRDWVVVMDTKGDDSTLLDMDMPLITTFPPDVWEHSRPGCRGDNRPKGIPRRQIVAQDRPPKMGEAGWLSHLILAHPTAPEFEELPSCHCWVRFSPVWRGRQDDARLKEVFGNALDFCLMTGGWTVVLDECAEIADREEMNLRAQTKALLKRGRARGISVISESQVPVGVPRETYNQASHIFLWYNPDEAARKRLSEISGANVKQILATLDTLDKHEFLWLNVREREMWISQVDLATVEGVSRGEGTE